jgi:hypothetical protein
MLHYRAHGYHITSDTELPLPVADPQPSSDLVMNIGPPRDVANTSPPGEVLAHFAVPNVRAIHTVTRTGTGLHLRYHEFCDFEADSGLTRAVGFPHTGVDPGVATVLASGGVLAVRLMLDGHLVLHASAVDVDGRALAVVGSSGMGKSTVATLMSATGHALVSDDVLRVDASTSDEMLVWPGSVETRLREKAASLAEMFASASSARTTSDGRLAVRAPRVIEAPVPLGAVIIPLPTRDISSVEATRVTGAAAHLQLIGHPRVLGWCEPSGLDRQFELLADLVDRVPVFRVKIPWGPPFSLSVAEQIRLLVPG